MFFPEIYGMRYWTCLLVCFASDKYPRSLNILYIGVCTLEIQQQGGSIIIDEEKRRRGKGG